MEHCAGAAAPAGSDRGLLTAITPYRSPRNALPTLPQRVRDSENPARRCRAGFGAHGVGGMLILLI